MATPPAPPQNAPTDTAAADSTVVNTLDAFAQGISRAEEMVRRGQYEQLIDTVLLQIVEFVPNLIRAVVILLLFWLLYRLVNPVVQRFFERSRRINQGLGQLLIKVFRVTFTVLVGVVTLEQIGFDVTTLLAGLGIAGIAIGFAARDTFENFIAGITILIDQPFRVGDNVEVDGTFGTVREITLRSTRIQTLRYEIVVMPNARMINEKVTNHTITGPLRVDVSFGIAYKEAPDRAREIVLELSRDDKRLVRKRPPSVVVTEMADSSVNMQLRLWIRDPRQLREVQYEYTERIFNALTEAGIEIPFPHRQLFIDEAKAFEQATFMGKGS